MYGKAIALLFFVLIALPASAATRFVSQSGGLFSGGTNCNGQTAISVATFNATTQAANDLNWICGTVTTSLAPVGSGGVGTPVIIRFDTGASVTKSSCGSLGCINLNGLSNYLIDGSPTSTPCGYVSQADVTCNFVIVATGSGTTGTNTDSNGIYARGGGSNIEIKNVGIANMYVITSATDNNATNNYYGVWTDATNIHVHNCQIHDTFGTIKGESGNNNSEYDHCQLYNSNWSVAVFGPSTNTPNATTQIKIHDNDMHDWANWDNSTVANPYHHDGCFAAGNNNLANGISFISCYNNYFHGTVSDPTTCATSASGSCMTAHVYMNDGNNFNTYNNRIQVSVAGQFVNNGFITYQTFGTLDATDAIWNNTVVGTNGTGGYCISVRGDASIDVRNNIMSNCNQLFNATNSPATTLTHLDFNTYQRSALTNAWQCGSNTSSTLAAWRLVTPNGAACNVSAEASSQALTGSLNLGSQLQPLTGSPVTGAGTNLTSLGVTALNSDAFGNPRPSVGNWDAGAANTNSVGAIIIAIPII